MSSTSRLRTRLAKQVGSGRIVRLRRRSRPLESRDGFVLDVGRKWVLLAATRDGGFFDGYLALRLADVRSAKPDTSFESDFARTQPEWPPALPDRAATVDLHSTAGLLRTLLRPGELFSIERHTKYDAQWIGTPYGIRRGWLGLWEVTPQATWHEHPLWYRLNTVTMIITGDSYQRGLAAMAGEPPADALQGEWTTQSIS